MDISALMKLRSAWSSFCENHPRFPDFLRDVKRRGIPVGTEITIAVTYPNGETLKAGLKLNDKDLELVQTLSKMTE